MSVAATELTSLIGLPWVAGARGPESYDCWGLFLAVQRDHFGRELPEIPVDALDLRAVLEAFIAHPERQRWQPVPQPEEGGGVLHAVRHAGVVFQTLAALDAHGWRIEGCYRFKAQVPSAQENPDAT